MDKCPRTGGECPYPTFPCSQCLINLDAMDKYQASLTPYRGDNEKTGSTVRKPERS